MIIGIDVDDTLVDTRSLLVDLWAEYYSIYLPIGYSSEVPENINTGWDDEAILLFWDLYRNKVAKMARAKEYASDALYNLKSNGHTIKIVTARPDSLRKDTLISLKRDKLLFDELITRARFKGITCRENGVELLIDDTQNNLDDVSKYGIDTLLFQENDNWKDVYKKVLSINKKKKFY